MDLPQTTVWQEEDGWLGYLQEHPDYWTQGETLEELEDNLRDLHWELDSDEVKGSPDTLC